MGCAKTVTLALAWRRARSEAPATGQRLDVLAGLLLVCSLGGCAKAAAGTEPDAVPRGAAVPSVSERTDEEIDAIWQRCRAQPSESTPISIAAVDAEQRSVSNEPQRGADGSLSKEQIRATIESNIDDVPSRCSKR